MGRFDNSEFVPGLKIDGVWGPEFWSGSFLKLHPAIQKTSKWVQMIPNTISDIFQPIIDVSYGLDVEIRPKSGGAHPQISAESQHPAHKKNQLWVGKYQKSCWE